MDASPRISSMALGDPEALRRISGHAPEELAEMRGFLETELVGNDGGRPIGVDEQTFRLQTQPPGNVFLGTDAFGVQHGARQTSLGAAHFGRIGADAFPIGEVLLHQFLESMESLERRPPARLVHEPATIAHDKPGHQGIERMTQMRLHVLEPLRRRASLSPRSRKPLKRNACARR